MGTEFCLPTRVGASRRHALAVWFLVSEGADRPAGWYRRSDGRSMFWNGTEWLTSVASAPVEPRYVLRKSRTAPGILLLVGSLLLAGAAFFPWVTIGFVGPTIGNSEISVGLQPRFTLDDGTLVTQRLLLVSCAAICGLLALFMLWTARRAWGPILRILYFVPWACSGGLCVYWWAIATSTPGGNADPDDIFGQFISSVDSMLRALGVYSVDPALGLYLWTIGGLLGLIGLVVPGRLYELRIPRR